MEETKSIFDIGYLYPNQDKIINFLNNIHSIPFGSSKEWEKEIMDFFRENPFVIYGIERSLSKEEPLFETMKGIIVENCHGVKILDTNTIFKDLCNIREAVNINKNMLKKYAEYFFRLSIVFRKMLSKIIDQEDTNFTNYSSTLQPVNYECKTNEGNLFYENVYFMCADGNIAYDFKLETENIRKRFAYQLNLKLGEKTNKIKKRNPLDSRLRHECFKRDNYTCKECGATRKEKMLHCDHIIPVSQGGTDELSNLQTLCDDCNLAKSDKCFKAGEIDGNTGN
jgi:hypothetical protein